MVKKRRFRFGVTTYLNLIFRLVIWFLLTNDFSLPNIILGIVIAFVLPFDSPFLGNIQEWMAMGFKIIKAIPQAYFEAVEIMLCPHNKEGFIKEKVSNARSPGLIFMDIFLITFTPKTIVTKYEEQGWYEVHEIKRLKK